MKNKVSLENVAQDTTSVPKRLFHGTSSEHDANIRYDALAANCGGHCYFADSYREAYIWGKGTCGNLKAEGKKSGRVVVYCIDTEENQDIKFERDTSLFREGTIYRTRQEIPACKLRKVGRFAGLMMRFSSEAEK